MVDDDDGVVDVVEDRAALRRSLGGGRDDAVVVLEDVIRSVERYYAGPFAARTVPTLRRVIRLIQDERQGRGKGGKDGREG